MRINDILVEFVTQDELDEKSTSQAQFRTMAAAAHNPAFARKVGIDTDVAQEFHGADRGQDYKDLPKKANEAATRLPDPQNYDSDWDYYNDRDAEEPADDDADYENMIDEPNDDWFDESKQKIGERGRGRPPSSEQDTTPVTPGRVEKTATGIRHHADPSRYGGTEPDAEDDHLLSKSHVYRLSKMTEPEVDEGKKVGNMDADKFDDALARMKKLAGSGPLKTVWDPAKRVYRNMPTAVQPPK